MRDVGLLSGLLFVGVTMMSSAAVENADVRPYPVDPASNRVEITLGRPRVIAQAPPEERRWGRFQFPGIKHLRDGRLLITFSAGEDSVRGYGMAAEYPNKAISTDCGKTWVLTNRVDGFSGTELPDGSLIRFSMRPSEPVEDLDLPEPIDERRGSYGQRYAYYRAADLKPEIRHCFERLYLPPGADEWQKDPASLRMPGELFKSSNGYFAYKTFLQVLPTPWGTLLGTIFPANPVEVDGRVPAKVDIQILESRDAGLHWERVGTIPFEALPGADPHADKRWQNSEPEMAIMPDGSLLCLIRTTEGSGVGPLYRVHSYDRGRTWTPYEVVDRLGVRPRLLVLDNGVTLATYGRPGLYLRATADPGGRQWDAPVALVEPTGEFQKDTCSYAQLMATGPDEAFVVYSNFNWPGPEGQPRKTILLRRILARPGKSDIP